MTEDDARLRDLATRERLLNESQRVAGIGSWAWDVASNRLTWSDTICALYGIAPADAPTSFDGYLALVHADDRARARAIAERAYADGQPFAFDHRVVHPDGTVRLLHGRGEVVTDAAGRVVTMLGSSEDVTERRRAAQRMRDLQVLAHALASALTTDDVAGVIAQSAREMVGADAAFVTRLSDDGTIELLRGDGFPPNVVSDGASLAAPAPAATVIRSGTALWVERAAAGEATAGDMRALAVLPLVVDGRSFGAVGFAYRRERAFSADDRTFVGALAGQCAQALLRATLFEAERSARAAERFLAAASRELAESLDHEATLRRVLQLAVPTFADWAVYYRAEGSGVIRRIAIAGPDDVRRAIVDLETNHPLTRDARGSIARAVRDGVDVHVREASDDFIEAVAMDEGHAAAVRALGYRSAIIVPMRAHDTILGALLLGTGASRRRLGTRELDLARRLADRSALAIESSRLFADERRARAEAEAARRRAAFLADASRILGESLDYTATLQRVARSFVPDMADWCVVDLIGDDGELRLVAVAHVDAGRERWARRLRERHPIDRGAPSGVALTLREGTSQFHPVVTDDMLVAAARSPDELALLREMGFRSYICAPLRVRDTVIGAISLVRTSDEAPIYDDADLGLAEELARRAATAIDHARVYRTAQRANQVKSEFLAVMSHELRTPLNAIGGYVELLELELRGPLTDAQRRDLDRIRVSQQHLLGLISAVLDLSRIESGRVTYRLESVPVDAFLQSLDALIAPQVAAKSLALEYRRCAASLGIRADAEKLRQVLLNLLSNAVRYTPPGGRITLGAEARDGVVAITVADTGIGIPRDALERIFEPFVQLDRTLTPARDGVGLGLAISRDLARGMGGELTASSLLGAGSTFTLTLPLSPLEPTGGWLATGQYTAVVKRG